MVRLGVIETPTDPWQGPVIPLNQSRGDLTSDDYSIFNGRAQR